MLIRSQTTAYDIKNRILNGHVFTLYDEHNKRFVIYKSKKLKNGNVLVWSRITDKKYTKLCVIDSNGLALMFEPEKVKKHNKTHGAGLFILFWNPITNGKSPGDWITIWHSYPCIRCHRLLTDPRSIERGYGPKCEKLEKEV